MRDIANNMCRDFAQKIKINKNSKIVAEYCSKVNYKKFLSTKKINESDLLIIGTIARSGTHYMMFLLTNYMNVISGCEDALTPKEMNNLLPNNWHLSYFNYHKIPFGPFRSVPWSHPTEKINLLGLSDISRSHSIFQKIFWKNSPVLHLYRNPLDYSVSLYNYKHKKRPSLENRLNSPAQVLELKFDNYVQVYKSYLDASKSKKYNVLRVSYEDLITEPSFYLYSILKWIGVDAKIGDIDKAVSMSSIQSVIKKEASDNRINPDAKDLEGSFISSGKIGQWKEHYSEEEYNYFYKKFKSCGVNFEDFIFE